jgi:tetratricopeptide (TPR) repeat protein
MAEHNDGNRGGKDRGNFDSGRGSGGGGFRGTNNSGGDPRGFRARDDRGAEGSRPSSGDRKPYGDRPARDGDRKPFSGAGDRKPPYSGGGSDRKPPYSGGGDRDRKPYGDRAPREGGERSSFVSGGSDRKPPYSGGGDRDRKPYGDRAPREGGERSSFGGGDRRPPYSGGGSDRKPPYSGGGDRDRKPYGDRAPREGGGERRSFSGGSDRKPPYSGGENRKPFGNREDRPARSFDREDRPARSFDRGDSGPRQFGRDRAEDRPVRVPNARDLRSANRPDRERSPQIDDDVTGKELDRATQHQIKTLEDNSAEWVARHLVMAGRLIDDEPELAFQHALAASRRGGRLAAVREAVGLTAYAAGHYGEALREFRTYRRISGSNMHLPVMADCERGLGRPDRALDMARSEEAKDLDAPGKAELAIVAAGARSDLGQLDAAVSELEVVQLDINRAFSYSPRLFRAYADALAAVGRTAEAEKWQRQASVAENALGLDVSDDPDIIDLGWDEEEEAREEQQQRRLLAEKSAEQSAAAAEERAPRAASAEAVAGLPEKDEAAEGRNAPEAESDDAESDFWESDDAESDEDSVEKDALDRSEVLAGEGSDDVETGHADSFEESHNADADADSGQPNRAEG